jgi:hypothetical protein
VRVERFEGLILRAGRDIVPGQSRRKPFQLMSSWQMQGEPFEAVAIIPFCGERKMFE